MFLVGRINFFRFIVFPLRTSVKQLTREETVTFAKRIAQQNRTTIMAQFTISIPDDKASLFLDFDTAMDDIESKSIHELHELARMLYTIGLQSSPFV